METKQQGRVQALIKNGPGKAVLAGALACALGAGGILAYFTATTDVVQNKYSVTEGLTDESIEIVEPGWDLTDDDGDGIPDAAQNVMPKQTLAKDPAVKNKSDMDVWCFAEVVVPHGSYEVSGSDAAVECDLFAYSVNEGWTEVFKDAEGNWSTTGAAAVADGKATHYYVYKDKVAPSGQTGNIFDTVTLIDLSKALGTSTGSIDVIGHAIQTVGFDTAMDGFEAMGL